MIVGLAHTTAPQGSETKFYENVKFNIEGFQARGLVVEVQYQQSKAGYSALIMGRKKEVKTL